MIKRSLNSYPHCWSESQSKCVYGWQKIYSFSKCPKEKEKLVDKMSNVIAKLDVGDVVKCCIKKITYFGIFFGGWRHACSDSPIWCIMGCHLGSCFIFQNWSDCWDKSSPIGFHTWGYIFSLKEITLDSLIEVLESVVGDFNNVDGTLQATQADSKWPDVESLIKEFKHIERVQSVSKGRFFLET